MHKVERCHQNDAVAAKELIEQILGSEFPTELSAYPPNDLEDLAVSYGKLGEAFFVAKNNGKVIGTVGIKREDDRTAFLRRLFVSPDYRRQNIGNDLIDRAVQFCKEVGYDELVFKTTSTMKSAIKLCERKGFVSRARLDLGPLQLFKYVLFLKNSPA